MRPTSVAAAALALLCACGHGYTNAQTSLPDGAIPFGGGGGGDAGGVRPDAGDGGTDAGVGRCIPASRSGLQVIDNCAQPSVVSYGGSILVTNQCAVQIQTGTATISCTGTAQGPTDAFDGGCASHSNCTSAALPGTINCAMPSTCSIQICDGGTCP